MEIEGNRLVPVALRSFRPSGEVAADFAKEGFSLFNVFPSGIINALQVPYSQFGEVWIGEGEYDWEALKKQVDIFKENAPDGYISVMVQLDTRKWFLDSHPECEDTFTQLIQTVGYKKWRKSSARWMCDLIDKMDELVPGRLYGVFLMAGATTEWYTQRHPRQICDHERRHYTTPNGLHLKIYREWLNDPIAVIPEDKVLDHTSEGIFRHPLSDSEAVKYWRFYSEIVADAISRFSKKAKEHTHGDKLIGCFYGYITGMSLPEVLRANYNAFDKVLNDDNIDVLFCPTSYNFRMLSSTSAFRIPVDSISLHRKLYFLEIDSKTHLTKNNKLANLHTIDTSEFHNLSETAAYIRREVGMVLAKGQGYWWFDMFGGYYKDQETMNELRRLLELTKTVFKADIRQTGEIAYLIDLESNYYLGTKSGYPLAERQTEQLNRTGMPWEMYLANDILNPKFPHDRMKLYIFANIYKPSKELIEKINSLRAFGKSFIFVHAPGYITENGFSQENMEVLTGMKLLKAPEENGVIKIRKNSDLPLTAYDFYGAVEPDAPMNNSSTFSPFFFACGDELDVLGVHDKSGKPAFAVKYRSNGGFDAFSAVALLPHEIIRFLAKKAGAFRYSESSDPIYLNDRLITLNSYSGGKHLVFWPKKETFVDFFTGEKYALSPDGCVIDMNPVETKMLVSEDILG